MDKPSCSCGTRVGASMIGQPFRAVRANVPRATAPAQPAIQASFSVEANRLVADWFFNVGPVLVAHDVRQIVIVAPPNAAEPRVDLTGKNGWVWMTRVSQNTYALTLPREFVEPWRRSGIVPSEASVDLAVQLFYHAAPSTPPSLSLR